jgi:hypothetical protein
MNIATVVVRGFLALNILFVCMCCCVFYLRRLRWQCNKPRRRRKLGFHPTSSALGNAFHTLQLIAEPKAEYIIEEKYNDEADEDEDSEPETPAKHLRRQLKRIRNGEEVDRLTVLHRSQN